MFAKLICNSYSWLLSLIVVRSNFDWILISLLQILNEFDISDLFCILTINIYQEMEYKIVIKGLKERWILKGRRAFQEGKKNWVTFKLFLITLLLLSIDSGYMLLSWSLSKQRWLGFDLILPHA